MNSLNLFGFLAVSGCMVCYMLEPRGPRYIFGFAIGCFLGSIYGFLQGAWPFGFVEAIWTCVSLRRWWRARV